MSFEKHGFDERIARNKSYAWCDRHLSTLAAEHAGCTAQLYQFYEAEGHKNWHLIPKVWRIPKKQRESQ